VWPLSGPIAGGTLVTITGTTLTNTSEVTFGGTAGTSLTVVSPTSVTVMTPARAAAVVKVMLTTPAGGSATVAGEFQFVELPTITAVSQSAGPVTGRAIVTINGKNLTDTSAVTFGGTPGTSITNVSDTSVTVITPANLAGVVDVILTTPGGSVTSTAAYTSVKAPTIAGPQLDPPAEVVAAPIEVELPTAENSPPKPISSALPPMQVFIKKAHGAFGRQVHKPKVVKVPQPKSVAPKQNREFTLLVHDAAVPKTIEPKVVEKPPPIDNAPAKPISLSPTPIQEFTKKIRGAMDRQVQKPKVENGPQSKSVAPNQKREFTLLVHDAAVKASSAVIDIPTVPTEPPSIEPDSFKRTPIQGFLDKTRNAIGRRVPTDEIPVVPDVVVYPPAVVIDIPTNPSAKHGASAMKNDSVKVRSKPDFLKLATILGVVDKTRDSISRRVRKSDPIETPAIPSKHLGLSTLDEVVASGPVEPNFFELAAIHESVDKARDTIGRRVRKSVVAVIGLLLIVASIDGYAVSVVTRQSNRLESEYREMTAANENVLVSAVASDLAIRSFLLSGDRSFIDKLEVARPQLVSAIADLERVAAKVGDQGLLQLANNSSAIVTLWLSTFVDRTTIIASADTPRGDQLAGAELINNLRGASTKIASYISDVNDKAVVVANRVRRQTIGIAALVLVVAFLVIAVLLVLGGSDISFPLINLSNVVNRIYRGENKARADDTSGPAEIRAVSRAVNELAYQQETAHEWVTQFNLSKTNFLNTVNHELRTPLTSITGYSELLGEDSELTHIERNRMATVINRNAFRLNDLIDNMLTVLRIDSMEVRFKMSTFDIRDVINESIESFRTVAESRELTIVSELGDVPFTVWADENEILRVIGNLISNAVKFSNPGGQIDVSARSVVATSGKHEVAVSVSDTGIGIIDAELQHVGSRFYRSSNAIAAAIPGTGIGLMIVGFIVHEHGGSWSLISSENSGTRAEIRLPLALESTSSAPAVGPSPIVG
jgi:signal transduction histidine kinase